MISLRVYWLSTSWGVCVSNVLRCAPRCRHGLRGGRNDPQAPTCGAHALQLREELFLDRAQVCVQVTPTARLKAKRQVAQSLVELSFPGHRQIAERAQVLSETHLLKSLFQCRKVDASGGATTLCS